MNDALCSGGAGCVRLAVFEPVVRDELGDGLVGVVGDLGQHALEVLQRIDAPVAAALDDGEEDGAFITQKNSSGLQGARIFTL
jgi:hypothetical protein